MCGEKPAISLSSMTSRGSPPRVRGEDGFETFSIYEVRITPACAGRR